MENFFTVHIKDQEIMFRQCGSGMYYFNTAAAAEFNGVIITSIIDSTPGKKCLLIMVEENHYWLHHINSEGPNWRGAYTT